MRDSTWPATASFQNEGLCERDTPKVSAEEAPCASKH